MNLLTILMKVLKRGKKFNEVKN